MFAVANSHIKAILIDEHGGQIKGLSHYFEQEYSPHEANWHILRLVKMYQVHYEWSIKKLMMKGAPKSSCL